ncbi:hypothetical protein PoB_002031100 [Plakobranchus ocellatus]|uniref:Secreted protein n=1 Tax=Plakobranchus ocellatus TaxID=259542 RepID=A0AAV3ZGP0_9GAST|nr:hypothetical protein PoB_002031100 [Plakobranchus ocellatus]
MFFRTACLIVAVAFVSAGDPVEDSTNALKLKAFRPGDADYSGESLTVRCSFNVNKTTFVSLTKLKMYASDVVGGSDFETLGSLTQDKFSYGLTRKEISVGGKYQTNIDRRSKLEITWVSPTSGYCKIYQCVATGRDPNNGKLLGIYKNFQVDAADGSSCTASISASIKLL